MLKCLYDWTPSRGERGSTCCWMNQNFGLIPILGTRFPEVGVMNPGDKASESLVAQVGLLRAHINGNWASSKPCAISQTLSLASLYPLQNPTYTPDLELCWSSHIRTSIDSPLLSCFSTLARPSSPAHCRLVETHTVQCSFLQICGNFCGDSVYLLLDIPGSF